MKKSTFAATTGVIVSAFALSATFGYYLSSKVVEFNCKKTGIFTVAGEYYTCEPFTVDQVAR